MKQTEQNASDIGDRLPVEMMGLLHDPLPGQRWISVRQHKIWRPATDVYETDIYIVVKVEIAGMDEEDFVVSLETKRLIVTGVRHDPAAKLGYQQMEIPYGEFETDVYLPWAIDEDRVEATYHNGFLSVFLPKARPRQVPVINSESTS